MYSVPNILYSDIDINASLYCISARTCSFISCDAKIWYTLKLNNAKKRYMFIYVKFKCKSFHSLNTPLDVMLQHKVFFSLRHVSKSFEFSLRIKRRHVRDNSNFFSENLLFAQSKLPSNLGKYLQRIRKKIVAPED